MTTLTQERLRHLLNYDAETGVFTWRVDRFCGRKHSRLHTAAGTVAGSAHNAGYIAIRVDDKAYLAHRLAWLHTTGSWPVNDIDHIDGDRCNNRFANLRDVTRKVNNQNRRTATEGTTSGLLGVCRFQDRWQAGLSIDGKRKALGLFSTKEAAYAAYVAAKRVYHEGCTL